MTQVPFLQVLYLIYGLLTCKAFFRARISGISGDSVQVDTAGTNLRRVLRGAASPFWHARWKHKQQLEYLRFSHSWKKTSGRDVHIRALVISQIHRGHKRPGLGHTACSLPLLRNTEGSESK